MKKKSVSALKTLAWTEKQIVEGAAGLALAGYLADQKEYEGQASVVVLCGANFEKAALMQAIAS